MKRSLFGIISASLAVAAVVALGIATGNAETEEDDIDIILSDMPLTGLSKMDFEGEHQANDLGTVNLFIEAIRCDPEKL